MVRHTRPVFCSLVVAIVMIGCASDGIETSVAFDPLTQFPTQATFQWDPSSNKLPADDRIIALDLGPVIVAAAEAEFAVRGYTLSTTDSANYLMSYQLASHSWIGADNSRAVAQLITWLEDAAAGEGPAYERVCVELAEKRGRAAAPVIGFTGTGGSGKSSVVDELVRRFHLEFPEKSVGLLLVDPTRRRSGGALLGDRIRMNAIHSARIYARSLATRQAHLALSRAVGNAIRVLQAASFDVIFVETAGIGQSDSEIVDLVDTSIYVMTPEYGAPSQLEKIDMLDMADFTVLNKSDRQGAADALRDVRKQWRRNHGKFDGEDERFRSSRRWPANGTTRAWTASMRLSGRA